MPKLIVTINEECCRCKTQIQKVLTCLQDEFCIEKIEFEKSSKVTITGKFDADKLSGMLKCKAGKFIKNIEKVEDKKEEKKDDKKKEKDEKKDDKKKDPPCKLVHVYPLTPYPPCQYPYQLPYSACPSWQGSSSSCYPQQCQCYYCCKPPERSSLPCVCAKCSRSSNCSSDHHGGGDGCCCGSSCSSKPATPSADPKPAAPVPAAVPYALPAPCIVCYDDNPSNACSVM